MRSVTMTLVRGTLIAGPVALAFASGGYFDGPRLVALILAWALVALVAVAAPRPLPRVGTARLTLVAFALLTGWIALSASWAPLADAATSEAQLALLYLATLIAAAAAFVPRSWVRALEPLVALGAVVVIGYGLSGRLLPGIIHLAHSRSAGGRLEQPLTYWNAMGLLAAMGLLLCARLIGDRTRPAVLRAAAAAAGAPLGAAVYLSFSRGALAAAAAGVIVLLLLAPNWSQVRGCAIALEAAVLGAFSTGPFPAVRALAPGGASPERAGLLSLLALTLVGVVAVLVTRWNMRVEREGRTRLGGLGLPRWAPLAGVVLVAAIVVVPVVAASSSSNDGGAVFGATSSRFSSVGSNRYLYWDVAAHTFADHPLQGIGAGGWVVDWLKHRTVSEAVRQPHSLWIQTVAEEGLVGLALLLLAAAGLALSARRAHGRDPTAVAGVIAALSVWAVHASFDWDWQLPAVTLVAMVLAGAVLAQAGPAGDDEPQRDRS